MSHSSRSHVFGRHQSPEVCQGPLAVLMRPWAPWKAIQVGMALRCWTVASSGGRKTRSARDEGKGKRIPLLSEEGWLRRRRRRGGQKRSSSFPSPLEATVQLRNSIPSWIAFHGTHGRIKTASGPWHTSGDWWRPNTWDREEWDIEVSGAQNSKFEFRNSNFLYRLYYDVHTDRWFAQGVYD